LFFFWTGIIINGLAYYFSFKSNKVLQQEEDKRISDVRNYQVLDNHAGKAIGLDVSEYQGKSVGLMWIPWKINIRSLCFHSPTVNDRLDKQFDKMAWRQKNNLIRSLSLLSSNENSLEQAALLLKRFL
jgi:lysozyme